MEPLTELRRQARERRDRAILAAKRQYVETLERIAAVEQDLLGHLPSSHKRMSETVEQVIPADRPFTTGDVMAALRAVDGQRQWYMRTVTNQITRLRARGEIRRLRRATRRQPALYARIGVSAVQVNGDKALLDVAAEVLEGRSLNAAELTVAVLEGGYQTAMGNRRLMQELVKGMSREPGRFEFAGKKWRMVE